MSFFSPSLVPCQILMQKATINASICNQRDEERWKEIGGKKTLIDRVKREIGI
ncbi:hypothetical protein V6Z12_D05G271700 [Gossypium hirsutum]